jgi:hypothetical protein
LSNYVAQAQSIVIGTVYRHTLDLTVVVAVEQTLKGPPDGQIFLRGETGHCVLDGPVTQFMKPGERFLVFQFKDHAVGRLGGILPAQGTNLMARFIDGFTGGEYDKAAGATVLPLAEAVRQVQAALAVARANAMRANVDQFGLSLSPHKVAPPQRPFRGLGLGVPRNNLRAPVDPMFPRLQITAAQAARIIDALAADGYFDRARERGPSENPRPNYTLTTWTKDSGMFHEHLGWGAPLRQRLTTLRQALDGDAATQMDLLLKRLTEEETP